jgi:dTDP-4-dehydrorhamnose 3,5-epimerase-like enzyme
MLKLDHLGAFWNEQMSLIKTIDFPPLGDERGSLVALEAHKTVPFDVKRVYYIFGTKPGVSRGFHAHRALQQVSVCVTGKCRMVLDDGQRREDVWLDSPTKGLLIGDLVWREMHDFSPDCVLLVLASEFYDETDYIRSYDEFKRVVAS